MIERSGRESLAHRFSSSPTPGSQAGEAERGKHKAAGLGNRDQKAANLAPWNDRRVNVQVGLSSKHSGQERRFRAGRCSAIRGDIARVIARRQGHIERAVIRTTRHAEGESGESWRRCRDPRGP